MRPHSASPITRRTRAPQRLSPTNRASKYYPLTCFASPAQRTTQRAWPAVVVAVALTWTGSDKKPSRTKKFVHARDPSRLTRANPFCLFKQQRLSLFLTQVLEGAVAMAATMRARVRLGLPQGQWQQQSRSVRCGLPTGQQQQQQFTRGRAMRALLRVPRQLLLLLSKRRLTSGGGLSRARKSQCEPPLGHAARKSQCEPPLGHAAREAVREAACEELSPARSKQVSNSPTFCFSVQGSDRNNENTQSKAMTCLLEKRPLLFRVAALALSHSRRRRRRWRRRRRRATSQHATTPRWGSSECHVMSCRCH